MVGPISRMPSVIETFFQLSMSLKVDFVGIKSEKSLCNQS